MTKIILIGSIGLIVLGVVIGFAFCSLFASNGINEARQEGYKKGLEDGALNALSRRHVNLEA